MRKKWWNFFKREKSEEAIDDLPPRMMLDLLANCDPNREVSGAMSAAFCRAMWFIDGEIRLAKTSEQREKIIDFFLDILKADLWGSNLTQLFFENKREKSDLFLWETPLLPAFPFPPSYIPEIRKNEPFGNHTIISLPYQQNKYGDAIQDLSKEKWDSKRADRGKGRLYPELDLIVVTNRRHHLGVASVLFEKEKEEEKESYCIPIVEVYPLTLCFPHFETNGAYWFDMRAYLPNGAKEKQPVSDIRIALLYTVAKRRWFWNELEKQKG